MSGHSKWSQIKHQKGVTDQKRGVLFSKLLAAITAAAKTEADPNFNPRLRDCVQKAKDALVPADNIERAIKKAADASESMDELLCEAYGPGGAALLIEAITDNRNRTIPQIKKILADNAGKWAETGSVLWAFEKQGREWTAKLPQESTREDGEKLAALIKAIEDHEDVQRVVTNSNSR